MSELKVWDIDETGFLVRGTQDVEAAIEAATLVDGHTVDELRNWTATPGWYRCNPCHCSGEHQFDLGRVNGPGRGNFEAVLLDHGW